MGWKAEREGDSEVLIGDEPVDAAGEMLKRIATAYMEDVKRNPSPRELAKTLELGLRPHIDGLLQGCEDKELQGITIRLRKKPKTQKIAPGDYFAVPLPSGGYGFGRIRRSFLTSVILGDFLAVRSDSKLSVAELSQAPVLFEALFGYLGLARWQWPVLGNMPVPDRGSKLLEKHELEEEACRLGQGFGPGSIAKKLDDELRKRFPER